MTSLERQLKRLKTPQTDEYRQQKYRVSFLYDRKDAAGIDCETHLRIANKGLKRLLKLNPELDKHEDILSPQSRELERAVLRQDENDELSMRLRKLINSCVVPFFMLNDCHEVLEYLIYKYKIHSYQPDDLLCAILPYHETRLFARALQLFDNLDKGHWGWLEPYKKEGLPVPKEKILDILSSRSKLPLVALLGDKLIEINNDTSKGGTFTSFYTTSIMSVLDRDLDEQFFVSFMPHVYKTIKKSKNHNLFIAGLVLIGYLAYTQELDASYLAKLRERLVKTHDKLKAKAPFLDDYLSKVLLVIDNHQQQN